MNPKIVIAGGNGFLGRLLAAYFNEEGYEVVVLCRKQTVIKGAACLVWDGITVGAWQHALEGASALINLAGKSVDCRYTEKNKRLIIESRVQSTKVLGGAIQACKNPPEVWLNASSATIYRHAEDRDMNENTGEIGSGFSVGVCKVWEKTLFDMATPQTHKTALRISIVLGNEGGVWPVLKRLCRVGLGGRMGMGTQYFSWLHALDFCRAVHWLVDNPTEGTVNISSPQPITNAVFMQQMRQALHIPFGLPHPRWLLETGAVLLQTETELVLKSRRVVPTRLLESGFVFAYPEIEGALKSLVKPVPQLVF